MKFRKRPVVVEAEQFFSAAPPKVWPDGVEYHDCTEYQEDPSVACAFDRSCIIKTLEGWMVVRDGDWIITGVKGEKYPCKNDIFQQTYERVED